MSEWGSERWLLVLAASVCVFAGFRRRSLTGLLLIIGGRMLAWWATPRSRPSFTERYPVRGTSAPPC